MIDLETKKKLILANKFINTAIDLMISARDSSKTLEVHDYIQMGLLSANDVLKYGTEKALESIENPDSAQIVKRV